jgi:hypothetical protein
VLDEIAQKIIEKKGLKNNQVYYYQIVHFVATEFFCFERKWWWIITSNILWIDIDKIDKNILVFYTSDKQVAEVVREVAATYALKCEETHRDHFPPAGAY